MTDDTPFDIGQIDPSRLHHYASATRDHVHEMFVWLARHNYFPATIYHDGVLDIDVIYVTLKPITQAYDLFSSWPDIEVEGATLLLALEAAVRAVNEVRRDGAACVPCGGTGNLVWAVIGGSGDLEPRGMDCPDCNGRGISTNGHLL